MQKPRVVLAAGLAESVIAFRGNLIKDLVGAGHDVIVAAPGLASGSIADALQRLGARPRHVGMRRSGMNPLKDAAYFFRVWTLFMRERPFCVISYTIKPVIYGTVAAWLAGVPQRVALITGLGYAFTGARSGPLILLVRFLYRIGLARADLVIFQNPDDLAVFRRLGIVGKGHRTLVVDGSGVDLGEFHEQPLPERPVFLMVARLLRNKGVREYVEAARRVTERFPEVKFRLAGWIDDSPDAISQSELDTWIRERQVEFLGRLEDVRPALEDCSVYVLPSYREGTPRTVLEAMATGRAIITTDVPGCRQTTVDGWNGFLVPSQSVGALEEAMLRFLMEPKLVATMGHRSREIAERKYDVRKVNSAMLNALGLGL